MSEYHLWWGEGREGVGKMNAHSVVEEEVSIRLKAYSWGVASEFRNDD